MIDRICAEAMTRGNRPLYSALTAGLTQAHRQKLEHLDGLKTLEALRLPEGLEHRIQQNRLLKRAREGAQMTAQHLRDLESTRRHATRVAAVLEVQSTIIERSLTCMTASWAVFSIGLNTVTRSSSRNPARQSTKRCVDTGKSARSCWPPGQRVQTPFQRLKRSFHGKRLQKS